MFNASLKVIEVGLKEILRGESYKPISYNCQTFTDTACNNERKSADATKWIERILFGSAALIVLGAVFGGGNGR